MSVGTKELKNAKEAAECFLLNLGENTPYNTAFLCENNSELGSKLKTFVIDFFHLPEESVIKIMSDCLDGY